jgi:hypothetical protein
MSGDVERVAAALHARIDGDWLLGGGGWGPDGWVDDIPLHGARISDVVRWAANAAAPLIRQARADGAAEVRARVEAVLSRFTPAPSLAERDALRAALADPEVAS